MNEDIKEIFNEIKHLVEISNYEEHYHLNAYFEVEHIAKLLNYITNLQKENQKLVKAIDEVRELINYYGITPEQNDNVILRHILKDLLEILNKLTELKKLGNE